MKKDKLFKNRRAKYHPSIEIAILDDGTWENIEITDSLKEKGSYEKLNVNPNPNSNKQSYFRKCLRRDKISHRGEELKKYCLDISDEIKIDIYVSVIEEKRKNGGKPNFKALTHKGHTPSKRIKANGKRKIN